MSDPRIPELVTRIFEQKINGKTVVSEARYMVRKEGKLWDAELIAWANERDWRLKRLIPKEHVLAPGERKPGEIAAGPNDDALWGAGIRQSGAGANPVEDAA